MGLTSAPATYARLKDIVFGPVPAPNPEKCLTHHATLLDMTFKYFCDDDYGGSDGFDEMFQFLHEQYFPRLAWAYLTLKPAKSSFFVESIEPLGMAVGEHLNSLGEKVYGLKASRSKESKIGNFPTPQNEKELEAFIYLSLYLKTLIPGRTDYVRVLKEAVIKEVEGAKEGKRVVGKRDVGKRDVGKRVVGFLWTDAQEAAFNYIKAAIRENVIVGNDLDRRHYLSVTISKWGFGAVFFQLSKDDEDRLERAGKGFPKGRERVIQFISQRFADTETRYLDIEKECLAILRALEEVRFIVVASKFPVVVYTDFGALVSILRNDDTRGRIAGWQAKMAEYDIDPRHTKVKNMGIADGLARMPYDSMSSAWTVSRDWEDVIALGLHDVRGGDGDGKGDSLHDVRRGDVDGKGGSMHDVRRGDGDGKGGSLHDVRGGDGEVKGGGRHDVRKRDGESHEGGIHDMRWEGVRTAEECGTWSHTRTVRHVCDTGVTKPLKEPRSSIGDVKNGVHDVRRADVKTGKDVWIGDVKSGKDVQIGDVESGAHDVWKGDVENGKHDVRMADVETGKDVWIGDVKSGVHGVRISGVHDVRIGGVKGGRIDDVKGGRIDDVNSGKDGRIDDVKGERIDDVKSGVHDVWIGDVKTGKHDVRRSDVKTGKDVWIGDLKSGVHDVRMSDMKSGKHDVWMGDVKNGKHDVRRADVNNGKDVWAGEVMMTEEYGTSAGTSENDERDLMVEGVRENTAGEIPLFRPSEKPLIRYEPGLGRLLSDGALLIQCDGSCRNNGERGARATIGVFCGENHARNFAGMVPPHLPQTNQTAELWAMTKALHIGKDIACTFGLPKLVIASDSEYVCLGLTRWISKWKKTGYKGVQNALMFTDLDHQIRKLETLNHVHVEIWKITRDENVAADELAQKFQEVSNVPVDEEDEKVAEYDKWLESEWYGEVTFYLLNGRTRHHDAGDNRRARKVRGEACKYVLVDDDAAPFLAYREVNGDMARCLLPGEVGRILYRFHDNHGHFSSGIMGRNILGRYYWPGRMKDIARWCSTCEAYQKMGPL